ASPHPPRVDPLPLGHTPPETPLNTAYPRTLLSVFLDRVGVEGWDEVDVAESLVIEWHGGGPEVWSARP
ncbi:hypothetical protein ABZ468_52440, partial [Streptomyces sp. NPDC005708]